MRSTALVAVLLALVASMSAAQDGGGSAIIDFDEISGQRVKVPCGSVGTWTITYTAPSNGVAPGGGIRIYRDANKYWLGMLKQAKDPTLPDYCTVARSDGGRVEFSQISANYKKRIEAEVRVVGTPLAAGGTITIKVGDTSGGSIGALTPISWQPPVSYYIDSDTDGDGKAKRLTTPLVVEPVARIPQKLVIDVPLACRTKERARLTIRAEDESSNVADTFAGTVIIDCTDHKAKFPQMVTFMPRDRGVKTLTVVFSTPGIHYVSARSSQGVAFGCGNPCRVTETAPEYRTYAGDMHVHTEESDGTGSVDFNYRYARDVSRLDFIAVSDHLDPHENDKPSVATDRLPPRGVEEFNDLQSAAARRYYRQGQFATFLAYEWGLASPKGGDHIVYYMDDKARYTCRHDLNQQYKDLRSAGKGQAFTVGHVGGRAANPDFFDPQVEPAVEINSMHGHFEWFAQSYLQKGHKVGFIGSSDTHFGLPGNDIWPNHGRAGLARRDESVPQGLALVYSPTLTRESIRDAVFARRTYATTNVKMLLEVKMDGHMMGEDYSSSAAPTLHINAAGTGEIGRVEIIRNQERIYNTKTSGKVVEIDFTDDEPVSGLSYYYVRVSQTDGEIAWSSPIFFTYTGLKTEPKRPSVPWNHDAEEDELGGPVTKDYLPRLLAHLKWRAPNRFTELRQVRFVKSSRGDYALFHGRDSSRGNGKIHIRWYVGFPAFRIHVATGWRDFGSERG